MSVLYASGGGRLTGAEDASEANHEKGLYEFVDDEGGRLTVLRRR